MTPSEKAKRKAKPKAHNTRLTPFLYVFSPLFVCGIFFYFVPLLNLGSQYLKWQSTQPEHYAIDVNIYGSVTEKVDNLEDGVAYMFDFALGCKLNPLSTLGCEIEYHERYGYPVSIWKGFILADGGILIGAENFVVLDSE